MLNIPSSYQLFTARQSRKLDEQTISDFGIDGFTLMEVAGTRAADFILNSISDDAQGLILCGKGNNAGDALVVARILSQHNISCTVVFVAGSDRLSSEAQRNFDILQKLRPSVPVYPKWDKNIASQPFDFIVDGMLGTGLNSDIRAPYSEVIDWANHQQGIVFAMDIPTGINADTGHILGKAIKADFTLAFGTLKQGCYLNEGTEYSGGIIFCELPFPNHLKTSHSFLIKRDWVDANRADTPKPKHKYDGGVLYIIAGSAGLTGAAILAAKSAWSTRIGAVILITPYGLLEIFEKNLIQIVKKPLGQKDDFYFTTDHINETLAIINEKPGTVLIGPGLGRNSETISFVHAILSAFDGNLVIDADALFALSQNITLARPAKAEWILTPHPGELSTLTGMKHSGAFDRFTQCQSLSAQLSCNILSKGMPSGLCTPSSHMYITDYNTLIFARAGFGDVLSGKLSAFWVLEKNPVLAVCLALLEGKQKADEYVYNSNSPLEPIHII